MSAASFGALLKQGEQLQQRAERRRGSEAAALFGEAVVSGPPRPPCRRHCCHCRHCCTAAVSAAAAAVFKPTCSRVLKCTSDACPPWDQAKYKEALSLAASGGASPRADDHAACLFGCAESLQEGAEATLAGCAQLPDEALTAAAVQQADAAAEALFQDSVAAYQRVEENGQPRVDALVCCGNALRCALIGTVPLIWLCSGAVLNS